MRAQLGFKGLDETLHEVVDLFVVEVHLWEPVKGENGEESNVFVAYKETAVIEITSYGGDTTGYQIPFTVHYQGDRVKGKFDISTKAFTPDA